MGLRQDLATAKYRKDLARQDYRDGLHDANIGNAEEEGRSSSYQKGYLAGMTRRQAV